MMVWIVSKNWGHTCFDYVHWNRGGVNFPGIRRREDIGVVSHNSHSMQTFIGSVILGMWLSSMLQSLMRQGIIASSLGH